MGMIEDQTTGPWIKKKPAERKYFSYTKSKSSYPISIKKKNFCLCTNYYIFHTKYMRLKSIVPYYLYGIHVL